MTPFVRAETERGNSKDSVTGWTSSEDPKLQGGLIMKPSISVGPPSGMLLVLVCFPLLGLVQSTNSNKASDIGHPHLGESDPQRCMRHHFVETITHPIYKCNSKVRKTQRLRLGCELAASVTSPVRLVTSWLNEVHLTDDLTVQLAAKQPSETEKTTEHLHQRVKSFNTLFSVSYSHSCCPLRMIDQRCFLFITSSPCLSFRQVTRRPFVFHSQAVCVCVCVMLDMGHAADTFCTSAGTFGFG